MLFVDYTFDVLGEGEVIIMDEDFKAKDINAKSGDKYIVNVTSEGRVIFRKIENGHSGTD